MIETLTLAGVSLLWLFIMFGPLEKVFAANKEQGFFRPGWWTDLLFFLGQYLVFASTAVAVISLIGGPVKSVEALAPIRDWFGSHPVWIQVVLVVLAGDFMAYWGHRAQHRFEFLWRFHSVHHTNTHIDWLGAHREHPLDGLYTQTLINLPALLVGFGFSEMMGIVAFRSLWAIFIHSNVRIPLGPFRYLLGSPALHHWHHAKDRQVGNYANLGPWVDVLFGTYNLPEGEPEEMGIEDPHPTSYWGLLIEPLLPTRLQRSKHE